MAGESNTGNQQVPATEDPDVFSDAELSVLKARLQSDPAAACAFALVQKQGYELLRKLARETIAKLAAMDPAQDTTIAGTDWRQLSGLARDRESAAKARRLLAQDLVIGALVNFDNPGWDPLDPSTSKDSSSSTTLALLNPALTDPQKNGAR